MRERLEEEEEAGDTSEKLLFAIVACLFGFRYVGGLLGLLGGDVAHVVSAFATHLEL